MTVLIITGPPAAGKNSVAPLIARQRARCAIIDVDQVRWMLVQPHAAPWEGEEGVHQMKFGVENACWLASRFAEDGCDVLLLDYLWDYTLPIYRQQLAPYAPRIVQLMPTRAEIVRRNEARGWLLTAHEVEMLYKTSASLSGLERTDKRIDNSAMSLETLAAQLLDFMDSPPALTGA